MKNSAHRPALVVLTPRFRCHGDAHTSPGNKTITQDCGVCHNALAVDEASPEILNTLGLRKP